MDNDLQITIFGKDARKLLERFAHARQLFNAYADAHDREQYISAEQYLDDYFNLLRQLGEDTYKLMESYWGRYGDLPGGIQAPPLRTDDDMDDDEPDNDEPEPPATAGWAGWKETP